MKIAKWIILGLVAVLLIAGLIVYLNLNRIVRGTIETHATDSLNLQTTLHSATVSLFGGKLSLDDLQIASPQGYSASKMLTLGGVDVGVKLSQLRDEPIHIASLTIRKPTLIVEQSGGKLNVQAVMDQKSKDASANGDGKRDASEPMKLIVDQLQVRDATVVIDGIPGLDKAITIAVPALDLNNVGNAEGNKNGAAIKDVVMQVVTALAAKGADLGNLPDQIKQQLNGQLTQVATKLSGEFQKQLGNISTELSKRLPGNIGKQISNVLGEKANDIDPGKAIEKGLGDFLGKQDDKKSSKKSTTKP